MTYSKQTWIDGDTTKPLSAARMNYIEDGIASNVGTQSADYYIWKPEGGQIKAVPRVGSALPAIPDGTFTAVMQAAVNNLTINTGSRGASGGKIHIARAGGADVYFINNEITINGWETITGNNGVPESQLIIEGDGATTFVQNSAGQNGFVVKNLASVVFRDFGMYVGASAKSAILGSDAGTNSPMSFWRGGLYNLLLRSNSTTAAPLHIKNQFSISGDQIVVQSSDNHGVVFENNHAQTSFGNSHFGFISSSASSTAPYAAFRFISSNSAKPMNLMTIEHMESVDDCYYGAYFKGASWIKVNFADLEAQTYNVYLDGDASYKSTNIHFAGGYMLPKDTTGTGIYCSANAGALRVEGVYLETMGAAAPVNDQNLFQSPNFYDLQIFAVADWSKSVIASTNKHTIRLGTVNADTINRFAGTVTAPTPAGMDSSTKVATTAFVKSNVNNLTGLWVGAYQGLVGDANVLDATYTAPTTVVQNHQIALACTDLRVVLPFGWKLATTGTTDTVVGNSMTVKVSLQVGTNIYPVTFRDGARSATVDPGGRLISDPIGGIWNKGTQFKVRILNSVTSGQQYPLTKPAIGPGINPAFTDNAFTKNTDIVDVTTAGSTANTGDNIWGACLLGRPINPNPFVLGAIGDSITDGTGDTGGTGYAWITRATNANVPLFRYTRGAVTAAGIVASPYYSMPMLSGCTHVIPNIGTNDLIGNATLATMKSLLSSIYKMVAAQGAKVIGSTLTPRTTSTDSWVTTTNQTASGTSYAGGASSIRAQVNDWIRAGADGLLVGYVETADAVETSRGSGIWKANFTADGLHPNAAGHAAMATTVNLTTIQGY